MAASLSTHFLSKPTCYNASSQGFLASPSLCSPFCILSFDPFSSKRRQDCNGSSNEAFLVRSRMEQLETVEIRSFPEIIARAKGFLYTLADAAVPTDPAVVDTVQKASSDWLSGLTDGLESVLKVESSMAMQNLSPEVKAIQQRYAGEIITAVFNLAIVVMCRTWEHEKQADFLFEPVYACLWKGMDFDEVELHDRRKLLIFASALLMRSLVL